MMVKEWFTVADLVTDLAVSKARIYTAISVLRRAQVLETRRDPDNYRVVLIKASDVPALRRFLRLTPSQRSTLS